MIIYYSSEDERTKKFTQRTWSKSFTWIGRKFFRSRWGFWSITQNTQNKNPPADSPGQGIPTWMRYLVVFIRGWTGLSTNCAPLVKQSVKIRHSADMHRHSMTSWRTQSCARVSQSPSSVSLTVTGRNLHAGEKSRLPWVDSMIDPTPRQKSSKDKVPSPQSRHRKASAKSWICQNRKTSWITADARVYENSSQGYYYCTRGMWKLNYDRGVGAKSIPGQ